MTNGYYTTLARTAVTVTGPDARGFLQGLVTQDMTRLDQQPLLYSALLTPQGKFEADFFIFEQGETITLDCDTGRAETIARILTSHRLRRPLSIATSSITVTVLLSSENTLKAFQSYPQPQHSSLGYRAYYIDIKDINQLQGVDLNYYDRLRLSLGVPDGARDYALHEDSVADMGLEKWNGVAFDKGCYMGQELTSRMHHRGLGKKTIYPVQITGAALPPFTDIVVEGNLIGEMRSSNGDRGLAMLRHDSLRLALKAGLATPDSEAAPI